MIIETSDIQDVKKEVSDGYFIFEVNDTKQAKLLLGDDSTIIDGSKIRVSAKKEKVPDLVKKLVLQDIKIYSAVEDILTLEDAFLKKTGGNVIE